MNRSFALLSMTTALCLAGFGLSGCAQNNQAASPPSVAVQPSAIDLENTICPVSGEKVGDSKYTEVYQGKIYHFCCDDCPKQFKADPDKYAKAVAADPAKYGVKQGS